MTLPAVLTKASRELVAFCRRHSVTLAGAESCTGGLVAAAITDISGASAVFQGCVVSYSDSAKRDLLGVSASLLSTAGAVSEACARAMAAGAARTLAADLCWAITGIAGPEGGSPDKPVGLVWFAFRFKDLCYSRRQLFSGDRSAIREQAAGYALRELLRLGQSSLTPTPGQQ